MIVIISLLKQYTVLVWVNLHTPDFRRDFRNSVESLYIIIHLSVIYTFSFVYFTDTEVYEAVALYDFKGRTERELSFKKGDNLLLYTKASAEWWEGAFAGKEGLVPSNYVAIKHQ